MASSAHSKHRWLAVAVAVGLTASTFAATVRTPTSAAVSHGEPAVTQDGTTSRVSLGPQGREADGASFGSAVSKHGRFVAFASRAANLVRGDTNDATDIFVRDRTKRRTTRVSVDSSGEQANRGSESWGLDISSAGRLVLFTSRASNLVRGDTNKSSDVFLHNRRTGRTVRISVSSDGTQGNGDSFTGEISADGRFVTFSSDASNLVPDDSNESRDVFVRVLDRQRTERVSVNSRERESNGISNGGSITGRGRYVAFTSDADNIVPDANGFYRSVFVRDRQAGRTRLVYDGSDTGAPVISQRGAKVAFSVYPEEWETWLAIWSRRTGGIKSMPDGSSTGTFSDDGRYLEFESYWRPIFPGDTNGATDVFVRDRREHATIRVSINTQGVQGNRGSFEAVISGDGRFVAFTSHASNLVPGDGNRRSDVFVRRLGAAP